MACYTYKGNKYTSKKELESFLIEEQIQFQLKPQVSADQLPLTLEVFNRKEFKELRGKQVNPITVLNSLKQSGIKQIERDLIKQVIEDNYKGQNKVDYNELETTVRANIMPLERITTSSHASYGMDNLGNGDYGEAKTIIFNAPIEHGVIGHFPGDFKASGRQNIKYQAKQLNDNTWVAVEEGYESQANDNNIYQYVGTAGTKEVVDEWIENYNKLNGEWVVFEDQYYRGEGFIPSKPLIAFNSEKEAEDWITKNKGRYKGTLDYIEQDQIESGINKGMFGHIRVWQDGEIFTVAELQSDYFQKNNAKNLITSSEAYKSRLLKYKYYELLSDVIFNINEAGTTKKGTWLVEKDNDTFKLVNSGENFGKDKSIFGIISQFNEKTGLKFTDEKLKDIKKIEEKAYNETLQEQPFETKQFIASQKIWEQRIVREAIKEASLSGATSLRFPTPYTLSVIEGYISEKVGSMPYEIEGGVNSNDLIKGDVVKMFDKEYIVIYSDDNSIKIVNKKVIENRVVTRDAIKNKFKNLNLTDNQIEDVVDTEIQMNGLKIVPTLMDAINEFVENQGGLNSSITEEFGQPKKYNKSTIKDNFNIIDLSETQQTVARKYEEIAELLKKEKPVELVTDENGFDWYEAKITKEDTQKPVVAFQKDITLTSSGFVHKGNVFLNNDVMELDTPVHEFGHLYLNWLKSERGDLYQKGLELAQSEDAKEYADYVERTQPNLTGEDRLNEILAQAIGDNGAKLVDKSWIENLWEEIKKLFGLSQYTNEQVQNMNLEQFTKAIAVDLYKEELFKEMQGYKKAEVFMEVDGEIVQAKNTNTNVTLPLVAKQVNNVEILSDINQIQQYDLDVLNANREDTVKILKEIEDNLISEGIDVAGLSNKEIDDNLMQFLNVMEVFLNSPTKENTDSFAKVYDDFFEKDLRPKVESVKQEETDRDFVRLDTDLSEEEVYKQQGLVKVKEGLYVATNKQDLDTLYKNLETYKKHPNLKEYVQKQISTLEDFKNSDNAEAVYLYKMYYGIEKYIAPIKQEIVDSTKEIKKFEATKKEKVIRILKNKELSLQQITKPIVEPLQFLSIKEISLANSSEDMANIKQEQDLIKSEWDTLEELKNCIWK